MDATETARDVKPKRRQLTTQAWGVDVEREIDCESDKQKKNSSSFPMRCGKLQLVPVFCLMVLLVVFILFATGGSQLVNRPTAGQGSAGDFLDSSSASSKDIPLDGLHSPAFSKSSCLSRYQSAAYRKPSPHSPSPYLRKKLRQYESLHRKCGPNSNLYSKAIAQLKSKSSIRSTNCSYLIWTPDEGVGNRILSLVSSFLYSLLTDRVLLIEKGHADDAKHDMDSLLCDPFPGSSWFLGSNVSLSEMISFKRRSPQSYGYLLEHQLVRVNQGSPQSQKRNWWMPFWRTSGGNGEIPAYVYLYLVHDYEEFDQRFFCEEEQLYLQKVPWLVLRSNNYFTPAFFLNPSYRDELNLLFPQKDTVFHHLGRYLLHPTNDVWGLITRSYQSYLSTAQKRVGVQIRTFDANVNAYLHISISSAQQLVDQILSCTSNEKLLPEVDFKGPIVPDTGNASRIAILITSLKAEYPDRIRTMYWEHPTVNGEIVTVYQPSHEEYQQFDKISHDAKAWAEIYLLSLSDVLVTSSFSTFGYVAQSLAGLEPWMLSPPNSQAVVDPPCRRVLSMEPCFHNPPWTECKPGRRVDMGALVPHVTHCEDMTQGLKLVDR